MGLIFLLFIFVIPSFKPFGMTGVWERSAYTTYIGDEIDELMRERNIIIESQNTEIRIRARNIGQGQWNQGQGGGQQHDRARITVFENANGISINSYDRTQLNFMHYLDDGGNVFTKIVVQEPRGAMSRKAYIEINLVREAEVPDSLQPPYNFVLNTGKSMVSFGHDPSVEQVKIENLIVNGTGHVSLPNDPKWTIEKNLIINSTDAQVTCKPLIKGYVQINGNSRGVTLGDVEGYVWVEGSVNNVYVNKVGKEVSSGTGAIGNAIHFESNGTLTVAGNCVGALYVRSVDASINVQKTNSADINTTRGTVNINGISGVAIAPRVEKLHPWGHPGGISGDPPCYCINEETLNVDAKIIMESGSLTLGTTSVDFGVYGHVYINKKYGGAAVTYANSETATGNCFIRAIDGAINVNRIRGAANIFITSSAYNPRVNVSYAKVAPRVSTSAGSMIFPANNDIVVDGQEERGDITITLIGSTGITIELYNTWDAKCHITGVDIDNYPEWGVRHNVNDVTAPIVVVKTSARFDLYWKSS